MKKKMEQLKRLHRTERILWEVLIACIFILFKIGIDIEYEYVYTVTTKVVHTLTIIIAMASTFVQIIVIQKIGDVEREVLEELK